jgi:hypothetical protein
MPGRRTIVGFAHDDSADTAQEKCEENEKESL